MTIDEPIEENEVRDILYEVLAKENLQGAKIIFQRGSNVGDGFLGVNNAIEVKKGDKELKLFVKAAPKNKNLREKLMTRPVFLKEIYFYSTTLPIYNDFLEKRTGKSLNLTGKCYATNTEDYKEMLIFDNLIDQGLKMHTKNIILNEEHVLLVLRSYAKFHGVSYVLKEKSPTIFDDIRENVGDDLKKLMVHFDFVNILKGCVKTIREYNNEKIDENILDRLDDVVEGCYDFLESSMLFEDTHKILTHGDCWMNNMMFKYKDNEETPTDMMLIDFQIIRINVPIFDLSYFFYCSAASVENLAKLDYYLQYYHEHLCDFLQKFGCDGEKIYPFRIFKDHWKQFSRFGLLMSLYLTKMVLSQGEETPNLADRINSGANHEDMFDIKLTNNDAYTQRIKNILLHFTNNKFI